MKTGMELIACPVCGNKPSHHAAEPGNVRHNCPTFNIICTADAWNIIATSEASGGAGLIALERMRHVSIEGWSAEHDDAHNNGQLAAAGSCYCAVAANQQRYHLHFKPSEFLPPKTASLNWPWEDQWWKPSDDPIRNLVKAGALIAAEIDRLQRKAARQESSPTP